MNIVLETSILVSDLRLSGPRARTLLDGLPHLTSAKLVVPQVVVDETVNKFRERVVAAQLSVRQSVEELGRLLDRPLRHSLGGPADRIVEEYSASLNSAIIDNDGRIWEYPDVSHQEVVSRALSRKKPFQKKGTGYRDFLIWSTVLEILTVSPTQTVLITANTRDFGTGDLEDDLLDDLERLNIPRDRLLYYNRLESFNETHILPVLMPIREVEKEIVEGRLGRRDLSEWAVHKLPYAVRPEHLEDIVQTNYGASAGNLLGINRMARIVPKAIHAIGQTELILWGICEVEAIVTLERVGGEPSSEPELFGEAVTDWFQIEFEVVAQRNGSKIGDPYVHSVEWLR